MSCIICGEDNSWGGSFCPHCEEIEQRHWEEVAQSREQEQEPTVEDLCEAEGRIFHGIDEDGPRCYCGKNRKFKKKTMKNWRPKP